MHKIREMFSSSTAPKFQYSLLLLLIFGVCCQLCHAHNLASLKHNYIRVNPNLRCPGKNEHNIWLPCKYGGYIEENPDPKNCGDRYVCYVGLNEPCGRHDKCADNAVCTMCGICQKCDDPENCSDFELCPNMNGFHALNFIKRLLEKRMPQELKVQ